MKSVLTPYGGTKFALSVLGYVGTFVLSLTGHIDGSVYAATAGVIMTGYVAGDVIQRKNVPQPAPTQA